MTTDPMLEIAKSMNDANRSSSNHGKLFLLSDIIMELDKLNLGVTSKAAIKTFLENKKDEINSEKRAIMKEVERLNPNIAPFQGINRDTKDRVPLNSPSNLFIN